MRVVFVLRSIEVYPVFFDLVSTITKKFPFIVNVKLFRLEMVWILRSDIGLKFHTIIFFAHPRCQN